MNFLKILIGMKNVEIAKRQVPNSKCILTTVSWVTCFQLMKNILFVTYGGGHATMTAAVAKKLIESDRFHVDVLALTTARKFLEKQGMRPFSFRDLPINKEARLYGERLLKGEPQHPDIPYEESSAYMGLSFADLVQDFGEKEAERKYQEAGRQAFLPVNLMKGLISRGQYDLVVATNSPRTERAAIEAAKSLGVPALCMVDLFALQGVKWIGRKGYANKVCVLAEPVKRTLCEAGRSDDEVVVTGNPAFDYLVDASIQEKAEKMRRGKEWGDQKVVLWCSQVEPERHPFTGEKGDPELPFRIEQQLKTICDDCGWRLVVRPHPSENMDTRKYLDGVEYGRNDELAPLLKAVDVVVVTSSTVGLEALLLKTPVLALNMSIFSKDMPFTKMGLAQGANSLVEIKPALQAVAKHETVLDTGLPPVGFAAQSVVDEIQSLLGHKV